jgi:hypothetical protein
MFLNIHLSFSWDNVLYKQMVLSQSDMPQISQEDNFKMAYRY